MNNPNLPLTPAAAAARKISMEILAKRNRNNPSEPEGLFMRTSAFNCLGKPFQFQHVVRLNDEYFLLDFYMEAGPFKIAIEVDGATHRKIGEQNNDRRRDKLLAEKFDILTFRIPARDLYEGKVDAAYMRDLLQPLWAKYGKDWGGRND